MSVNAGYTVFARLVDEPRARAILANRAALPFERTATTHFATITIIDEEWYGRVVGKHGEIIDPGENLPRQLMLATSFCGPPEQHVRELMAVLGDGLRALFACCEGVGLEDLEQWILENRHDDTFYSGMQYLSPDDVRRQRALRDAIERYIDTTADLPADPLALRTQIRDEMLNDHAWVADSFAPSRADWWALNKKSVMVAGGLAALIVPFVLSILINHFVDSRVLCGIEIALGSILAIIALAIFALVVAVRVSESEQTYVSGRQPDPCVRALAATQNRPVINEFTISGPIKAGFLRPLFLQVSLWVLARIAESAGGDIPTVATARWIPADGGRRLIFISNYTNAAEPYVRDFIDVNDGAMRINVTFGFGYGYPKTEWVVLDGALTDPNGFIYVVTEHQHPTAYWYGPYTDISIDNIKLNRKIREGLQPATVTVKEAQAWLHLL